MDTLQAVYDVKHRSWWGLTGDQHDQLRAWAIEQGIDPNDTYRWEIHLIDMPLIRVFEFETDERGRVKFDEVRQDLCRRPPYDLPISSMPPVEPAKEAPRDPAYPPVSDPKSSQVSKEAR